MNKTWLFLGTILLFLFSCRKEITSWDTHWSFPVVKDQLNLEDLVSDSLKLKNDTDGCKLTFEKTIYRVNLSEFIKIPDTTITSELAINFPSLNINPGTILSQKDVENQLEIGSAELKKIKVKKGKISITFFNPLATKTFYTIEIPSFTKDGVSVKQTLLADKGTNTNPSVVTSTLDLSGYTIDLKGVNNNTFNTIVTNFDMQLDPNSTSATKVTNKDITKMAIQISGIQIEYAQGFFGNLQIESSTELAVPVLRKFTDGSINLSDASVELNIQNSCKLMAKGKINSLESLNSTSGTDILFQNQQLNYPFFIAPAFTKENQLIATEKKFLFNSSNSNLLAFIENLGDIYKINYGFELNPYGNLNGGWDEFFPTSEIAIRLKSIIPLNIHVKNVIFKDTLPLNFSKGRNVSSIQSGQLKLQCTSTFPIDAGVVLFFLDGSKQIIETIHGNSNIKGKSNFSTTSMVSTVYFTPNQSFFNKMNKIQHVIVQTSFNSVEKSFEIPYNGKMDFQLSTDFNINTHY